MSRKSSLASQNSMKLNQEMRECRMAYLSVLSSTSENMTSSKELTLGLYVTFHFFTLIKSLKTDIVVVAKHCVPTLQGPVVSKAFSLNGG